jgi:hypothetical protein
MKHIRVPTLIVAGTLFLAMTGCNPAAHQLAGMGSPMPASVPAGFPVYPGALANSQTYGRPPTADGSKDRREFEDITWATDDGGGKTFAFYKAELAKGDWVVESARADGDRGGLIAFNRKSSPSFGGTIRLSDGTIHVIMGQDCPCGTPG